MKLLSMNVYGDLLEELMTELINEDFLNEERFAKSYCRGKFGFKKWGKQKLIQQLNAREISDYCIKKGLEEIDEEEYETVCKSIIVKKLEENSHLDLLIAKDKVLKFTLNKGYEPDLILQLLRQIN